MPYEVATSNPKGPNPEFTDICLYFLTLLCISIIRSLTLVCLCCSPTHSGNYPTMLLFYKYSVMNYELDCVRSGVYPNQIFPHQLGRTRGWVQYDKMEAWGRRSQPCQQLHNKLGSAVDGCMHALPYFILYSDTFFCLCNFCSYVVTCIIRWFQWLTCPLVGCCIFKPLTCR